MRIAVVAATVCLSVFGLSAVTNAQAAITRTTSIPAQGLGPALQVFANERDFALVYRSELVSNLRSQGAAGELTAEEALAKLLAGTGLTYRFIDETTVTILPAAQHPIALPAAAMGAALRLAQAQPHESPGDDMESDFDEEQSASRGDGESELPRPEETGKAIPEMLVRGQRTINADIQRTEDDPQPYVVFDRVQIERSMSPNLEDFLKTRLPMNTTQATANQSPNLFGNTSQINLRGLGVAQTLILVDGRRIPGINNGAGFLQGDINGLPLAAIERIEVLPSTASGIYGGGATGGVVNIITRKDYAGLDLSITYGDVFDGMATNRRYDANGGFSLEGGRTHVVVTASHSDVDALRTGDRDFVDEGRQLAFANNPAAFVSPPLATTPNIRRLGAGNLVLDNGTALTSPFTFIPAGYQGRAVDDGMALVANAGQMNLELPDDLTGGRRSLTSNPIVESLSINVRRDFGSHVDAFLDSYWFSNEGRAFSAAGIPTVAQVSANAPNNPFNSDVLVSFPTPDLSFASQVESETLRALGGVIVRLPADWIVAAEYLWSRSRLRSSQALNAFGDPDGTGPGLSITNAILNGSLDVMRDTVAFPNDVSPFELPVPSDVIGPADAILRDATLRFSGPLLHLPAGRVKLSGLLERREQSGGDSFRSTITAAGISSANYSYPSSENVTSYYLEGGIPLVSEGNGVPLVHALELQASARRDKYETTSRRPAGITLPSRESPIPPAIPFTNEATARKQTLALRYAPVSDVVLRASLGTGFLPASNFQIVPNQPIFITAITLVDPKRGNVPASAGPLTLESAGNPNLLPEESESWSAGLIFTPRFAPGLRLSLDYTHIDKEGEIRSIGTEELLDLEDQFPGRIIRDPLTPADIAAGFTGGRITTINQTLVNIAQTHVEAYDAQLDYTLQTAAAGDFQFYAIATYQPQFERQTAPDALGVDSVSFSNGPLAWRGNGGLTWQRGPWMLGWNTQYFDSHLVYTATASAATITSAVLTQGSARIPSQIYHDAFAQYRFDDELSGPLGMFSRVRIRLGIQNVLDETPPILATTGSSGGFDTYGDPRLRRWSLTLRKTF